MLIFHLCPFQVLRPSENCSVFLSISASFSLQTVEDIIHSKDVSILSACGRTSDMATMCTDRSEPNSVINAIWMILAREHPGFHLSEKEILWKIRSLQFEPVKTTWKLVAVVTHSTGLCSAVLRGSSSAVPSFVLGTLSKTFCLSVPQHPHLQRMDNYNHSLGLSSEWSVSECTKCLGLPLELPPEEKAKF